MDDRVIVALDLKSFYASVECVERGLDIFTTPLVVCDTERGANTIVLSCTPYMKSQGAKNVCRRKDLPYVKNMIYATPRMGLYLKKSNEVFSIVLRLCLNRCLLHQHYYAPKFQKYLIFQYYFLTY